MKIDGLKVSKNKLKFTLKDSDYSTANALRRAFITEIPTMAIDEIDIYENTSTMFDEYIAHRIGLIPIITNLKDYDEKSELIFNLNVQGPCIVYSKDLVSKDKKITPVFDSIPIVELAENQVLRLEAKAVIGIAKTHAKFQSCACHYAVQKSNEGNFDFEVESFGNHDAEKLMEMVQKVLLSKIDELEEQIK